jgi:uncharacterized protein YjeT (DUF2065 family)
VRRRRPPVRRRRCRPSPRRAEAVALKLFLSALGLALALEGAAYALFPQGMRRMLDSVRAMPDSRLRLGGLAATALGVGLAWLALG